MNFRFDRWVNLEDHGEHNVQQDQDNCDPEACEEKNWHQLVAHDTCVHIDRDKPVVYYHEVEQSHYGAAKRVKVHQEVVRWTERRFKGHILHRDFAAEYFLTYASVDEEDDIEE